MNTTTPIQTLTRVFRLGSISLSDPDPSISPEDAVKLYAANYPIIESCTLAEPFVEANERLVYKVEKPEVKTKG
jgi:PRTRC genetic system protein C